MPLRQLQIKGIYRTATDSLIRDFYLPCLAECKQYDRAVGYFSSSMLAEAGYGLSGLIKNGGKMRLIIGHPLTEDEFRAVKEGQTLQALHAQIHKGLVNALEVAGSERTVHSLELLSWMVATNSIEIRYAFKKIGMYHEKIGVLTDSGGDQIVFHGSANESASALLPSRNFESLAVYPSWKHELFEEYAQPFIEGFRALWEGAAADIISVPVPSETYELLVAYRQKQTTPPNLDLESFLDSASHVYGANKSSLPRLPTKLGGEKYELRAHQMKALRQWKASGFSGIFALATGSGKTVTALHAVTRFCEQGLRVALVVAVPYQILAEQWVAVMKLYNMRPIKAFYSRDKWESQLKEAVLQFNAEALPFLSVVVVNDTLCSQSFQKILSELPLERVIIVGDECHHHANESMADALKIDAKFRLGMSATPWNPKESMKQAILEDIYGPVVSTYSLRDALEQKVLCPYQYVTVVCEFDDDEAAEYEILSKGIATLFAQDPSLSDPAIKHRIQKLANKRTRLLGSLRSKLRKFEEMLNACGPRPHTLVYCGEGRHPIDGNEGLETRVIEHVVKILSDVGCKPARITASESMAERVRILEAFDDGFVDTIAAMRVLDEGFDIPSCRTAFILASANSFRQYVQRRGRVLRKAPGKKQALIYDFVPFPNSSMLKREGVIWRRQVLTELIRLREFVQYAVNEAEQHVFLNDAMKRIGLGAILYEVAPIVEEELYGI